jgi:hypothetical protein
LSLVPYNFNTLRIHALRASQARSTQDKSHLLHVVSLLLVRACPLWLADANSLTSKPAPQYDKK